MRLPTIHSAEEAISYHVGLYYEKVTADPMVRRDLDRHRILIESLNKRYLSALNKIESVDYEKYKGGFIENMDFLTKVFSKIKERDQKSQDASRLRNLRKKGG